MADLPQAYVELRDRLRIHSKQIRKSERKHPERTAALSVALTRGSTSEKWGAAAGRVVVIVIVIVMVVVVIIVMALAPGASDAGTGIVPR